MGGKKLSLITLFLFVIPITIANFDYNETGNYNTYFEQGTGFFNAELSGTDLSTRSVDTPKGVPLVSDLDQDGTNEIIVFDGTGVKFYQNKELDIVNAFSFPDEDLSNALAYNIDRDNFTEIIIALEDSQVLHIIEYNGSDVTNVSFTMTGLSHIAGGQIQIKCRAVEDCFMTYANTTGEGSARAVMGVFFNSSTLGTDTVVYQISGLSRWCKPIIPSIAVADYDRDNIEEYIFAFSERDGADLEPHIFYVNVSYSNVVLEEHVIVTDSDADAGSNCENSGGNPLRGMTAPIVFDIDGSLSNGLETIIAYFVDNDEYVIKSYKGCSEEGCGITELDDYPESCVGFLNLGNCPEASSLSNIIKADIFRGTEGIDDFCVFGYNDEKSELDALCGSESSTRDLFVFDTETMELVLNDSVPFNVSGNPYFYNGIVHSAQHSSAEPTGKNLDEFVTSYGILSADFTDTASADLSILFASPKENVSMISVDAEKVGREDLIGLALTNVWYIDDQFSNEGGQITEYSLDPCIDSTIQINSSSKYLIEVTDKDSLKEGVITDTVGARVIIYQGESNEQDTGWSNNLTSGTTFTFEDELIFNKTTGSSTLRIMGRDTGNPDDEDIIDFTFSVANAGVVKGDCTTTADIPLVSEEVEEEEEVTEPTLTEDATANVVTRALQTISDLTGLGGTTLWLIGMLVMTVLIWYVMAEENGIGGSATFGTIAMANVLAIILGTRLDIFGTGLVIILVLIIVVILAVFLGKFLTGLHSSET